MSKYSSKKTTTAEAITVVGIDLGKTWIELCGQDAVGKVRLSGKYRPEKFKEVDGQSAAVSGRAGGVWSCASLGAGVAGLWSRGKVDGAAVCQAVCAVEQE